MTLVEKESLQTWSILSSTGLKGCHLPVVITQAKLEERSGCSEPLCTASFYLTTSWLVVRSYRKTDVWGLFFHDTLFAVSAVGRFKYPPYSLYSREMAFTLHMLLPVCLCVCVCVCVCVLVRERVPGSRLLCMTLLFSTDEIRCLSVGSSQWSPHWFCNGCIFRLPSPPCRYERDRVYSAFLLE